MSKSKMWRFITLCLLSLMLSVRAWAGILGTVSFSPDGSMFLSESGYKNQINLWETKTGKLIETFGKNNTNVRFDLAVFSTDGKEILLHNNRGELIWWNIASGKDRIIKMPEPLAVNGITNDRKIIVVSDFSSFAPNTPRYRAFMHLYDTKTGKLIKKMRFQTVSGDCLTFFPDDKLLLMSNSTGIKIRSIKTGRVIRTIPKSISSYSCKVSPDKNSILFSISPYTNSPDNIWLKGLGGSTPQYPEKKYMDIISESNEVGYSANDPNIAYVAGDGKVPSANGRGRGGILLVWDLRTGKVLQKYAHGYTLMSAAFAPDGKSILVQDESGDLILLDIETGTVIRKYSIDKPKEKTAETAYYPLSAYNTQVLAR